MIWNKSANRWSSILLQIVSWQSGPPVFSQNRGQHANGCGLQMSKVPDRKEIFEQITAKESACAGIQKRTRPWR